MGFHYLLLIVLWLPGTQEKLLGQTRQGPFPHKVEAEQISQGQGPLQHQAAVHMKPNHPSLLRVLNGLFCVMVQDWEGPRKRLSLLQKV